MSKLGLVFAGGGGRGAYQIGVWRALREYGLDRRVCAVSGTSVGALNAALFAQGDLAVAESVWEQISPAQIFVSTGEKDDLGARGESLPLGAGTSCACLLRGMCPHAPAAPAPSSPQGLAVSASLLPLTLRIGRSTLVQYAATRLAEGMISNEGLGEMIAQALDPSRLAASPVRCYATCYRICPGFGVDRYLLGRRGGAFDRAVLLASAAIPIMFPVVQVDHRFYWDGGIPKLGDNVPVAPAYQDGCCDAILVVHLSEEPPAPQGQFPKSKLIDLFPSKPLGGPTSTLDFTGRGARFRLDLGYRDGLDLLGRQFPL